jgi:hypothetical protein
MVVPVDKNKYAGRITRKITGKYEQYRDYAGTIVRTTPAPRT